MTLEEAYLQHILLHLRTSDPDDGLLTTYMNSWFAHHNGEPFLRHGRPCWLSWKSSKRVLGEHLHAISSDARRAHAEGRFDDLVIDHTIPSAELIRSLKRGQFTHAPALRAFLKKRFTLALLTKFEHNEVLRPFKSVMTEEWSEDAFGADESLRYCRYRHARTGIDFEVLRFHD